MIERLHDPCSRHEIGKYLTRYAALEIDRLEQWRLDRIVGVDDNRPPQSVSPPRAAGSFVQLTATKTMSARAACSRVPAWIQKTQLAYQFS